jgi:hypothetical protein
MQIELGCGGVSLKTKSFEPFNFYLDKIIKFNFSILIVKFFNLKICQNTEDDLKIELETKEYKYGFIPN